MYFDSSTKTVTNHKYKLNKSFQEILYRINAWVNRGSGWIIELIESQYINISTYRPLVVGSSYIDLPKELKHSRKGLIVVYRGANAAYEFIKAILKEHKYCKKIMKDEFNKNLVMTDKEKYFNKVIIVGFVKRLLIVKMKKLEIIVILLVNLEAMPIGIVILTFN